MMSKKLFFGFVLMLTMAFLSYAQEYNAETDFKYEIIEGGKAVRVTGYTWTKNVIRIPPRIQNLPVIEIGDDAFSYLGRSGIQIINVSIPDSVTKIGSGAFSLNLLTNIIIPDSVTYIGNHAFAYNRLTNLIIPDSVTHIGDGAFSTNQITSISISNNIRTVQKLLFANNSLSTIVIPDSVTLIDEMAFLRNPLTSIVIGANVVIKTQVDYPTFANGFDNFYNTQGRKAGTYTYRNGQWSAQFK